MYSFNTICGAVSMRETNSQKQVSSIEFIKSSDLGKDPLKADVCLEPIKVYPPRFRALALRSKEGQTFETEVLIADQPQSCFRIAQVKCYELCLLIR